MGGTFTMFLFNFTFIIVHFALRTFIKVAPQGQHLTHCPGSGATTSDPGNWWDWWEGPTVPEQWPSEPQVWENPSGGMLGGWASLGRDCWVAIGCPGFPNKEIPNWEVMWLPNKEILMAYISNFWGDFWKRISFFGNCFPKKEILMGYISDTYMLGFPELMAYISDIWTHKWDKISKKGNFWSCDF